MRSAFRDDHEEARLVFGLAIDQEDFKRNRRKSNPLVAALLKNTTFLSESDTETRSDCAYRHKCLLQVYISFLGLNLAKTE
jgi:hypothetical protein